MATNVETISGAPSWAVSTAYSVGDHVENDTEKVYICTTAGTSAGSGGPTGTGTGISDNTVVWDYVLTRDHSTISSWEAATDIALAGNIEQGQIYNHGELVTTAVVTMSGATGTSSTAYRELMPASGEGFQDNTTPSDPLLYDSTNGAAIRRSSGYGYVISLQEDFFKLHGLQFDCVIDGIISSTGNPQGTEIYHNIIYDMLRTGISPGSNATTKPKVYGNLVIRDSNESTRTGIIVRNHCEVFDNTVVNIHASAAGRGFVADYTGATTVLTNNLAINNGTNDFSGTFNGTVNANASGDTTAPGTTVVTSITFADQFEATNNTDWRLKSGADVLDAGSTSETVDIIGTSRPQNSIDDIGCYELEVAPTITAAITGTASDNITDAEIVSGGETIIITLTGDTWVAAGGGLGQFDSQRQAIINGLDSDGVEATGWNAEVRDKQGVSGVVRTSDTVVTITLDAQASYSVVANETITVTISKTVIVTSAFDIVASPTFDAVVTASAGRLLLLNPPGLDGGMGMNL